MDPQSRLGEFSSSASSCGVTRWGPFAVTACRCCGLACRRVHFFRAERHDRFHSAVRRAGGRCPAAALLPSVGVIASGSRAVGRPRTGRPPLAPVLACTFRPVATALWAVAANCECVLDRDAWDVPDGQWRIGRPSTRPVLKHGPRSLTCAQVIGSLRNLKAK